MKPEADSEQEGELSEDLTLLLERIDLIVQRLATAVFLGPSEATDAPGVASSEPVLRGHSDGEGNEGGETAPAEPCRSHASVVPWL